MPLLSSAQVALTELLHQRLAAAGCQSGRFDVSGSDAYFSLSGQNADGKTLYFWEFGHKFHELVSTYLQEQYDEHTAQLTIKLDVATAQAQHLRTPKPKPVAPPKQLAPELRTTSPPDRTAYGLTLAAQVAACLDQGATLSSSHHGYGGMGLARGAGATYHYGEVWDGVLSPSKTLPSWAAFVTWLATQSDFSLAPAAGTRPDSAHGPAITRQRLTELTQHT